MFAVFDKLTEFASGRRFGFLQAPELKSLRIDCLFDRAPREVVGRSVVRADRAGGGPGTMVLRELAAHEVACEGPQISPRFRLENINSHGLTLSAVDDGRQTCRRRPGPRSRRPPDRTSLCVGAYKPWLPSHRSDLDWSRRRAAAPPRRSACGAERASTRPRSRRMQPPSRCRVPKNAPRAASHRTHGSCWENSAPWLSFRIC